VKSVQESSFIIDTGKREYSFRTDEDTRYSGKKMKKGRIATVTYTGKLKKDPQALAVYCIKPKKKNKKEPVPDPKPEPKPQPKPQPKPVVDPTVTVYGEILNVDDNSASIQDEHGDAIDLTIDDNTTISSGYLPAVGDHVQVTYNKDTMVMIDLQLLFRPDTSKKSTDEQVDKQADNAGDKALANDDTQTSTNDETE
jgi:NAD-dependent SIR2 family protein deacetylase